MQRDLPFFCTTLKSTFSSKSSVLLEQVCGLFSSTVSSFSRGFLLSLKFTDFKNSGECESTQASELKFKEQICVHFVGTKPFHLQNSIQASRLFVCLLYLLQLLGTQKSVNVRRDCFDYHLNTHKQGSTSRNLPVKSLQLYPGCDVTKTVWA